MYGTGNITVNISIEEGALYFRRASVFPVDFNVSADICINEENISGVNYEVYRNGHEAGEAVKEDDVEVTCTKDGGYYKVVYCQICEEELSRDFEVTVTAAGHVEKEAVKENVVEATSTKNGSYDEVVYCQICEEELSRIPVEVAYVTGETDDDEVVEEVTEVETENETTSNPTTGDTITVFITIFAVAIVGLAATLVIRKRIK